MQNLIIPRAGSDVELKTNNGYYIRATVLSSGLDTCRLGFTTRGKRRQETIRTASITSCREYNTYDSKRND